MFSRLYNSTEGLGHENLRIVLPPELGVCVTVVRQLELLSVEHVYVVVWEGKLQHFFGKLKTHRVCLRLDQEGKRSIVDVIGDWRIEDLNCL